MASLSLKASFLELEWEPQAADKNAAWDLYVELLTRITTQPLPVDAGDEKAALDSVYQLFPLSRNILQRYGRDCMEFAKVAIVILNQIIRPFTAKWHKISLEGGFDDTDQCIIFRSELGELQAQLATYTQMLAEMAGVEDLSNISS